MDINDFRSWHTLTMLVIFIAIVAWAYSKKRKSSFDDAANLPFADESRHEATLKKESEHE
jgi:cytochrome c oxidase cbb3-type subunit 4